MLHELKINGLPETTDSLAWSENGDLCIATNVRVHLYIPARRSNYQIASGTTKEPWTSVILEVNTFNDLEWPVVHQQPYADLSIGEEESESHVISCSWSAQGLALHDRCMLGILTANGLFSLWDADGDTSFITSWKRVLVVNRIIEKHFASVLAVNVKVSARRYRLRAAAWSRSIGLNDQQVISHKIFLLAVLNDQGEIILLEVQRSEETAISRNPLRIIEVLNLDSKRKPTPDGRLDVLEWSQWHFENGTASVTLSCATEGETWPIRIHIQLSQLEPLQITSSILTPKIRAVPDWNVSPGETSLLKDQFLKKQLNKSKRAWETSTGDGHPAFTRFYGTARYKSFYALHVSFHPRTVVEYTIQAHEFSVVFFSHPDLQSSKTSTDQFKFDWEGPTEVDVSSSRADGPWRTILAGFADLRSKHATEATAMNFPETMVQLYIVLAFFRGWDLSETTAFLEDLSGKNVNEDTIESIDEYREESSTKEALQQIEDIVDDFLGVNSGLEVCSICDSRLKWYGEKGAICAQGHQFDRCSLTLLAIQEPGISKFCSSCSREYIDKNHLMSNSGNFSLPTQQFLAHFFKTFPKCIYCDGILRSFS